MRVPNYYCAGESCRQSTRRLAVRVRRKTYFYCVRCGRRLERRECDTGEDRDLPLRRSA